MAASHFDELAAAIAKGRLVLLLGAGASDGSQTRLQRPVPSTFELSQILADESGFTYSNESLPDTLAAATQSLGKERVNELFRQFFQNCQPSDALNTIARFPWPRLYTLNIDDALERSLHKNSPQTVAIRRRNDHVVDHDIIMQRLDLVKLMDRSTGWRMALFFPWRIMRRHPP